MTLGEFFLQEKDLDVLVIGDVRGFWLSSDVIKEIVSHRDDEIIEVERKGNSTWLKLKS